MSETIVKIGIALTFVHPGGHLLVTRQDKAKTQETDPFVGIAFVPVSGPAIHRVQKPAATPEYAVFSTFGTSRIDYRFRRICAVPVSTPFPYIPMHIVKAKGIGLERTDRGRSIPVNTF
jgi:hypothetical protein